jgi:CMP-N-acetylneuraminic acid synthetase
MYKNKKILAIIPARAGSKGLPGKNIKPLLGKPLIGWSIEQAKLSKYIDEICVSTDGKEIAAVSEKFGVKVSELRPAKLAEDKTSTMDVVEYLLERYKSKGQEFDILILLEPTSPLRKIDDIDNAIELLAKNEKADGVISVGEVQTEHPSIVKKINSEGKIEAYVKSDKKLYQRQQMDKAYFPYGVIYMIKTEVFNKAKMFYTPNVIPYFIERWQNYEVDDLCDFLCIERIMKARIEGLL